MIVEWSTDEGMRNATRLRGPWATEATDFTARLDLTGLPADAEIFYRVSFAGPDAGAPLSAPVHGRFRTAPGSRRDVRFLWSGDTAGQGWGINEAWGGMRCYETMRADRRRLLHPLRRHDLCRRPDPAGGQAGRRHASGGTWSRRRSPRSPRRSASSAAATATT